MKTLTLICVLFAPLSAVICYVGGVATYCEGIYCAISHQSLNGVNHVFQLCGNMGLGQTGNELCPEREYNPYVDEDWSVTCCIGDYCNAQDSVPTVPTNSMGVLGVIFLLVAAPIFHLR